ncbi:hypothetical protein [[Phormidium] sp. ETS-05]|uniref:hypothetical protein n=1 Tax=[Phormidium] sp. ETS-05 TaxID=222819 RepID=UPI0035C89C60
MSESISTSESYFSLIDEIADNTLKGKIKAKEQVYRLLVRSVSAGTGEIFERCLQQRLGETELRVKEAPDELKQAKAQRVLRALQMVVGEWERWVKENQGKEAIAAVVAQVVAAPSESQIMALLRAIDPNRDRVLDLPELVELARCLQREAAAEITSLGDGLIEGIGSWQRLEPYLVSWIYERASGRLGFGEGPEDNGGIVGETGEQCFCPIALQRHCSQPRNRRTSATTNHHLPRHRSRTSLNFATIAARASRMVRAASLQHQSRSQTRRLHFHQFCRHLVTTSPWFWRQQGLC